ncbi:MAG: AAA family ATPase [Rhodothermaceae bacterium]|nr:AAA family ATPase [Rhodothermaceae bacterium]
MSITAAQKKDILHLLRQKYPNWTGFGDDLFRRKETNYKRTAAKKATSLLSESNLAQLLVTRDTGSFLDRLHRLGNATNLLQNTGDGPEHGDLEILHIRTLDKSVFCAQIYHLIHGSQSIYERLDAYLHYVEDHELPNTWTFPTYFLQFCSPETEVFIEPRSTGRLLNFLGISSRLSRPSAEAYKMIKDIFFDLKRAFGEFSPYDLIDIQSVVEVCFGVNEQAAAAVFSSSLVDLHDETSPGTTAEPPPQDYSMFSSTEEELFWQDESYEDSDPTMLYISEISDESGSEATNSESEAENSQAFLKSIEEKNSLRSLFKSFMDMYMSSPVGVARAVEYAKARDQAEQNFSHLIARHELGEEVTNQVFLHLLPHNDIPENQHNGAWVHPIGGAAEELLTSLYRKYPTDSPIRQQIAEVLLEFIRHCVYKANALEKSSEALARLDTISIIDLSSITPILHALKPNQYLLLHDTSIEAINRLMGTSYGTSLRDLPELNAAGMQLIQAIRGDSSTNRIASVQDSDLFDIFSYWLVENNTPETLEVEVQPEMDQSPPVAEAPAPPEPQPAPPVQNPIPPSPSPSSSPQVLSEMANSLDVCSRRTGIPKDDLNRWLSVLARKKMLVFQGPVGTGKTFLAQHFAHALVGQTDGLVQLMQFHPQTTRASFWEPHNSLNPGQFHSFCQDAQHRSGPCIFIIDEINQGNVREIFGELLFKMEYGSTATSTNGTTHYTIPENVFIIGTMCPQPDSAFHRDLVLKRRFAFIPIMPNYELLRNFHANTSFQIDGLIRTLMQLNASIEAPYNEIGITYFLREDLSEHIEAIWQYEVEPAIETALSYDPDKLESFRWAKIRRRLTR